MAHQAAITVTRGALLWGASAGVGSLILFNNDDLSHFLKEMSRHAFHLVSSPKGNNNNGAIAESSNADFAYNPSYNALTDQISRLSAEVNRLRNSQGGSGLGVSWGVLTTGAGIVGIVMYVKGMTLGDLMYVTKKNFEETVEKLKNGIENLSEALEEAREDLAQRIGLVEDKVESTRISLEQKIEQEIGDVKREVVNVGEEVRGLATVQGRMSGVVHGLQDKFYNMEQKLEDATDKLGVANRGIYLLCNVVAEGMGGNNRNRSASLYEELLDFTNNNKLTSAKPVSNNNILRHNSGLKLLVTDSETSKTDGLLADAPTLGERLSSFSSLMPGGIISGR